MHRITEVNEEVGTATCSVCGPTRVQWKGHRWACRTVLLAQKRRYNERHGDIRDYSPEHGIRTKQEAEEFIRSRGGRCEICGKEEASGKWKGLVIDHDHDTRELRGVLCRKCNSGLGFFGDGEELVRKALQYLTTSLEDR